MPTCSWTHKFCQLSARESNFFRRLQKFSWCKIDCPCTKSRFNATVQCLCQEELFNQLGVFRLPWSGRTRPQRNAMNTKKSFSTKLHFATTRTQRIPMPLPTNSFYDRITNSIHCGVCHRLILHELVKPPSCIQMFLKNVSKSGLTMLQVRISSCF